MGGDRMTVEENARSLVISAFQSTERRSVADAPGLALVLAQWLGIGRPRVVFARGQFEIDCITPADAKLVVDWFGGTRVKNVVRGHIVDLTL